MMLYDEQTGGLPEWMWQDLPTLAKALWAKTYREARDAGDPATVAWDRIRREYVFHEGSWTRKADLPGYQESKDRSMRSWVGEGVYVMANVWAGDLTLPGNRHIPESEVDALPEEARRRYDGAHEQARHRPNLGDPHVFACDVVRSEFRWVGGGWVERTDVLKGRAYTEEFARVCRDFFTSGYLEEDASDDREQTAALAYFELPEDLKEDYRRGYKRARRKGSARPNADAQRFVWLKYERTKDGWRRRPPDDPRSKLLPPEDGDGEG